jgi:hypothetical protein
VCTVLSLLSLKVASGCLRPVNRLLHINIHIYMYTHTHTHTHTQTHTHTLQISNSRQKVYPPLMLHVTSSSYTSQISNSRQKVLTHTRVSNEKELGARNVFASGIWRGMDALPCTCM